MSNQLFAGVDCMTGHQTQLDTRALELAITATTKIDDHEQGCRELGKQNRDKLSELDKKVSLVHSRIDALVTRRNDRDTQIRNGVIVGLLGLLGFLLVNGAPWQ